MGIAPESVPAKALNANVPLPKDESCNPRWISLNKLINKNSDKLDRDIKVTWLYQGWMDEPPKQDSNFITIFEAIKTELINPSKHITVKTIVSVQIENSSDCTIIWPALAVVSGRDSKVQDMIAIETLLFPPGTHQRA